MCAYHQPQGCMKSSSACMKSHKVCMESVPCTVWNQALLVWNLTECVWNPRKRYGIKLCLYGINAPRCIKNLGGVSDFGTFSPKIPELKTCVYPKPARVNFCVFFVSFPSLFSALSARAPIFCLTYYSLCVTIFVLIF